MTIINISLLLLVSLLPLLTFTAHVRIVNGREAAPHSRPYMVSLQVDGEHVCGGFLISQEFVLTAAHCWEQGETLTVVVGAHDLTESTFSDRFRVRFYIPHPDYTSEPIRNDIMLLKLQNRVSLNNNIGLIALPMDADVVEAETRCSVAGWGDLRMNGPTSDRLREANMATINNAVCEQRWGYYYAVSQMICAHGRGGTCTGDSGGPLVCGGIAVGVTSFGFRLRCNSPTYPNVYTRISSFLPWIRSTTRNFK